MNRKPNGRGWSLAHDRELIALAKTKRLNAIAAHFRREPERILKTAARLGISIRGKTAK
jgi:hypothetical protein